MALGKTDLIICSAGESMEKTDLVGAKDNNNVNNDINNNNDNNNN